MYFKQLTDNQILALAIDEWLMGLDDDDWEEALRHIEKRKMQRAKKRAEKPDSQEIRAKLRNAPTNPRDMQNSVKTAG